MDGNRLSESTSPYLLQHAENPVNWHPWDEHALKLAKDSNKPILLSIGYSACHWCHVMAHESFEDEETAALMNDLYINIKVDREERPDLDKVYQTAFQLMNRQGGGWPLTVFLTPDEHIPFFTGTYFPPRQAYGRPSFKEVLSSVAEAWSTRETEIRQNDEAVLAAFGKTYPTADSGQSLSDAPLKQVVPQLAEQFDSVYGGFSKAPKFPHPDMLFQCVSAWFNLDEEDNKRMALDMLEKTAKHMALGGINDHIGGGFCRYSTDEQWMIPHFEKMLYDNGSLLGLFAELYQITQNEIYANAVMSTAAWVQNEMQSSDGGYYSAQDADSEGQEGKFYVWTRDEIEQLLTASEYKLVERRFSLDKPANFEGKWHLHCDAGNFPEPLQGEELLRWESSRKKLLSARQQRIAPATDDKILTAWNALMINGMAKAAIVFKRNDFLDSAERSLNFILKHLWQDGRLLAVHRDGSSHLNAYLDDYAYLMEAILSLLSVRWNSVYLNFCVQLADVLLEQYQDKQNGGFYFTANDHESLIHRPKPYNDDAMPSGNGVAAKALFRLGYLLGQTEYIEAGESTLKSAWGDIEQYPLGHCSLLQSLQEYLHAPETIIIRGPEDTIKHWKEALFEIYHPNRQVFAIPDNAKHLPEALKQKKPMAETCAYVCKGMFCLSPATDYESLVSAL